MAIASAIAEAGDIRGGEEGVTAESGNEIGTRTSGEVWREVVV
jgi:hypothetical protein